MADATQIAVEQEYFDHAAECRERSRATLIAAPASAAGPIAGMSAVKRTADKYLARMADPDEAVAIGRFETEDETLYVGKRRISDDDGEPLVINWQAPAAAPFYRATFDEPIGVLRKRISGPKRTVSSTSTRRSSLTLRAVSPNSPATNTTASMTPSFGTWTKIARVRCGTSFRRSTRRSTT